VENVHIFMAFGFCNCAMSQKGLNKADHCMGSAMARKKIKLKEEAISEILVTDTDLESGAEASDVEDKFEEEEEEEGGEEGEQQQQQQLLLLQ
jgi:hypothetical protein